MTYKIMEMLREDINDTKNQSKDYRAVKYAEHIIVFIEEFHNLRERVTELEKRLDASK